MAESAKAPRDVLLDEDGHEVEFSEAVRGRYARVIEWNAERAILQLLPKATYG